MSFNHSPSAAPSFSTTVDVEKHAETPVWVFPLLSVGGGLLLGVITILLVCRIRAWRKRVREADQKSPSRVTFNLPPYKIDQSPYPLCPTQLRFQQDHLAEEEYCPLNPAIYDYNEEDGPGSPFMGTGRLCFSLRYDRYTEQLQVRLIRATRLTPIGENVSTTPYVKIHLLPDKKRKVQSRVQRRTSNPNFYEDFVFSVFSEDLPNRTLRFTVCEFDRFSRQQVIGHVAYPFKKVDISTLSQGTGEIWVDISEEDSKEGVDKGELLFSLQFLPTACRLTVAVLKARGLNISGDATDLDPFVKVSMILGGKTVKKRKTVTSKKTASPVYNEAFTFTILPSYLDRVSFILSVYTVPRLGGSKKLIGRAVVGPYMYSTGQGLSHWNDMISSSRNPVAQWHKLI